MPHFWFVWNDEIVDYRDQHDVTPDEFEVIVLRSRRIQLTSAEQRQLDGARKVAAAMKDEILAEGRKHKQVWITTRTQLTAALNEIRSERERLGLSLAEVEAKSGLKRSAFSRLENESQANPTLLTIERYAAAVGVTCPRCTPHLFPDS